MNWSCFLTFCLWQCYGYEDIGLGSSSSSYFTKVGYIVICIQSCLLSFSLSACLSFSFSFLFFLLSEQNDGCKNPKHKNLNPMTHNWFCVNEAIYSPEKNDCCIHCFGMVLFILDMGPDYFEWGWKVRFLDLVFRWQCLGKKNSCLLSNSQCTLWIFEIDKLCSCVLRTTFLMSE